MAEKLVEFLAASSGSTDTYKIAPKWENIQGKPTVITKDGGNQTINGNLGVNYLNSTWLQSTSASDLNATASKICVFDGAGRIYYRTLAELKSDLSVPAAYSLPDASASTKGGVKIGSNLTVSSGTLSLTKANVTAALGYTPPTSDTNTHHTAKLVAAASTSATGNASSSGSVYLNVIENGAVRSSHKITGGGATSVSCDASGNITISSTNTTYSFNGAVSTIKDSNLTASRALVSNSSGKVAVSDTTLTELGYVHGVTSSIQTQLNNKAAANHTHKSLVWNTF